MYFVTPTRALLDVLWMYFVTPVRAFLPTCRSRDFLDESMLLEVGEGTSAEVLDESILPDSCVHMSFAGLTLLLTAVRVGLTAVRFVLTAVICLTVRCVGLVLFVRSSLTGALILGAIKHFACTPVFMPLVCSNCLCALRVCFSVGWLSYVEQTLSWLGLVFCLPLIVFSCFFIIDALLCVHFFPMYLVLGCVSLRFDLVLLLSCIVSDSFGVVRGCGYPFVLITVFLYA